MRATEARQETLPGAKIEIADDDQGGVDFGRFVDYLEKILSHATAIRELQEAVLSPDGQGGGRSPLPPD